MWWTDIDKCIITRTRNGKNSNTLGTYPVNDAVQLKIPVVGVNPGKIGHF